MKIIFFLGILCLMLFIYVFISFKEGMVIDCPYKLLGPIPNNNIDKTGVKQWDKNVITDFIKVYNKENSQIDESTKITIDNVKAWTTSTISEEEAKFYIKNKSFPYNTYISNKLKSSVTFSEKFPKGYNTDNISVLASVRMIYKHSILDYETKLPEKPDSLKIFNGEIKEPSCSSNKESDK